MRKRDFLFSFPILKLGEEADGLEKVWNGEEKRTTHIEDKISAAIGQTFLQAPRSVCRSVGASTPQPLVAFVSPQRCWGSWVTGGCFAFCKSFIHVSPSQSTSSALRWDLGKRGVCLCAGSSIQESSWGDIETFYSLSYELCWRQVQRVVGAQERALEEVVFGGRRVS